MTSISEIAKLLREGDVSCTELTREYLGKAKKQNPELNAYISITEETALEAAAGVDSKLRAGQELPPLAGIPFVLKDNIATKGIETTCASGMLAGHVPLYDAAVWEYLQAQGSVLIGKGNMDELGMGATGETSHYGVPRNPCNTDYVAGGSSGGVAVAVASGTAAFGIATDTGGSIRQPASLCGLVGLKPTYGAVSRHGLIALASSLDQIGTITTTVRDAAAVFDAICMCDERDAMSKGGSPVSPLADGNVRGTKIGVPKEFYENLDASIGRLMEDALKAFEKMGATLIDVGFPLLHHSLSAYVIISCAEAASNLGCFDGLRYGHRASAFDNIDDFTCKTRSEGFGAEVKRRILLGTCVLSAEYYDAYFAKALMLRNAIKNEYKRLFGICDCLVTPTVPMAAKKIGEKRGESNYRIDNLTASVNIAGLPAISIPCGYDSNKLPAGLQIIGDKFREDMILNAALAFEK